MSVGTEETVAQDKLSARAEMAVYGVQVDAPVRRSKGAGPSDDGHLVVDGANAALPVNPDSPYVVRDGRLWLGESDTGLAVQVVRRPRPGGIRA